MEKDYIKNMEEFETHYVCWEIPIELVTADFKFCTFNKNDADIWHKSAHNRSFDTHTYNKYKNSPCFKICEEAQAEHKGL